MISLSPGTVFQALDLGHPGRLISGSHTLVGGSGQGGSLEENVIRGAKDRARSCQRRRPMEDGDSNICALVTSQCLEGITLHPCPGKCLWAGFAKAMEQSQSRRQLRPRTRTHTQCEYLIL